MDEVVGHCYRRSYNGQIYVCYEYDPEIGFLFRGIVDPTDHFDCSERAIDRTVHRVYNLKTGR